MLYEVITCSSPEPPPDLLRERREGFSARANACERDERGLERRLIGRDRAAGPFERLLVAFFEVDRLGLRGERRRDDEALETFGRDVSLEGRVVSYNFV